MDTVIGHLMFGIGIMLLIVTTLIVTYHDGSGAD
jgi:hypothetical protein